MKSFKNAFPRPLLARTALTAAGLLFTCLSVVAQSKPAPSDKPWLNPALSPDERADLVLKQLTQAEKMQLVHGTGWGVLKHGVHVPPNSNLGAGFVPGVERLGLPDINLADSAVGVRMAALQSRYATLLPSALGMSASWDPAAAHLYGEVIGRELRDQGFNMSIGGGVDLTRDPRNGRNFEYLGEDPILAGELAGELASGVQSQKVMGDIKHFAVNDQETGRMVVNVEMPRRVLRETDLLAFEIAIKKAQPAGVMCSYNKVNGDYACENDYLLNQVLKKDWGFKGFVLSDWEATHSTVKAANAGLDQEMPGEDYLGKPLEKAIADGQVKQERLDDMAWRVVRSMFAAGVVDTPVLPRRVVDPFRGRDDAQKIEEESLVLLKNDAQLPLKPGALRSIALIGGHADVAVLSGGGSAQVDAPGGNAIKPEQGAASWQVPVWFPSSPLKEIRALAGKTQVDYTDGTDLAAAAAAARKADVAIVFATQYMSEGKDSETLSLPENQDALISAVAKANPHTIVILENGGPVTMPWITNVKAVLESWYPGIGGAQAISRILFGNVNPSGKLPITFAASEADLPLPKIPGIAHKAKGEDETDVPTFTMSYPEGLAVGYRWYEWKGKKPLFAFGHGLSYTSYTYTALKVDAASKKVSFRVTNTGAVAGDEVAQVYVRLPDGTEEPFSRLVAYQRIHLEAKQSQEVSLSLNPHYMSVFDEQSNGWKLPAGSYKVMVGGSSDNIPLTATLPISK